MLQSRTSCTLAGSRDQKVNYPAKQRRADYYNQKQIAFQCPMRFGRKRGLQAVAVWNRFGPGQPYDGDQDQHQHSFPCVPNNHHSLPWQEYIHNIVNAIEAEADANMAFKDAYSSNQKADSNRPSNELKEIDSSKLSSDVVKNKLQQAMQKQDDARRFIWAAEYKANEFFCRLKDRRCYDASSVPAPESEESAENQLKDIQVFLHEGVEYARVHWSLAVQLAHNMWQKSQAAVAGAASSLQSAMSPLLVLHLQPVESKIPIGRTVESLQQMRQMRDDSVADVGASLARRFRQGTVEHDMHTEEAREWLENVWLMDPEDIAINDKPGSSMPHTAGMHQQSATTWASVVGLMAVMSVWPGLANW